MSKYVDKAGLTHYTQKIKDGTIVAGKANSVPASGITGVIDLSHIPQGALERVVTVANQTARFALTTANVQLGDTVKQTDNGRMYIVVNESKLSSADGYMEYTAGQAASVPWSGVTGKPTKLSDYGITDGVNGVSVTGSGNAVTAATISGHGLTLTKGATFLTSHQSLAHNHTLKIGNTSKSVSLNGTQTWSLEEIGQYLPVIDIKNFDNDLRNAKEGVSVLKDTTDATKDGGSTINGFVLTGIRNMGSGDILDQFILYFDANVNTVRVAWASYGRNTSPNYLEMGGWHELRNNDSALSDSEIDAAIAAAK